ncbi:rhodanese-like domain-containing protein [Shewanella woodyi]|uniref:rhodanese-like domain-containing protein n=1 Tax=Shewanella woodyi TaxID=60961 RepID=UPI0007F881FF|nr:rhodanese-like domain-containing protein [Shewanella woodyi]
MNIINKGFKASSYFIVTLLLLLSISQSSLAADKNPQTAWSKIDAGALVVDVRTAQEFTTGHLDNAINIPFETIAEGLNKLNVDKEREIVLYCRSGRRSGIANDTLIEKGYTNTYNGGGYKMLSNHKKQ